MTVMPGSSPAALVSGASRGIGLGIATHLAEQGWSLTLTARNADALDKVAGALRDRGAVSVQVHAGDMAHDDTIDSAVRAHESAYGYMNALVIAAGVGSAGPLAGYPMRRYDKQFTVNVRAPFALISQALPLLRAGALALPDRGGRIVALSSIEGVYPEERLSAYSSSKAALIALTQSVNAEEAAHGVSATAISPGYVATDMSAWVTDRIPHDQMIVIDDIVKAVDLVLSVSSNAVLPHIVIARRGSPYTA